MSSNFCLLPEKVNDFRKALKEKEITIPGLLNMTSEQRITMLREYAGDAAPQVNTLFEEKLVLKNRILGLKNWASKVGEIGKYSKEGKAKLQADISEYRARQQERIFSPKENEQFLSSLAEERAGIAVTEQEAKTLFDLSRQTDELRKSFNEETGKWASDKDRADYGAAKVQYDNYYSELKGEGKPWREILADRKQEFKTTAETNLPKAIADVGVDTLRTMSDNAIALVASVDNSFLGRQGLKVLFTHPKAWLPAARKSFVDIWNTMGGKATMDALMADAYSRPNWLNGQYEKAGIVNVVEEQFPTSLPEQIPGIGRVYKASEVAFKGSALRMRMDLYDMMTDMAKNNGKQLTDPLIRDIGKITNSLTARGKWGKYGESPIVKLALWSPRMLKANFDILTGHGLGVGLETPFARKQAFKNVLKIAATVTTILTIAKLMKKDSVETDPTSTNFGKIIVNDTPMSRFVGAMSDFVGISSNSFGGKTTYDVTGGLNSLVTLFSRQVEGKTKSSTTGVKKDFGSGFGETSRFDSFIDFLTGKTAPLAHTAIDFAKGQTYDGKKPTPLNELYGLTVPISVQNFLQIGEKPSVVDWSQNPGVELKQFQEQVGEEKFKEANEKYNERYIKRLKDLQSSVPQFKSVSEEDKQKAVTKLKDEIKGQIFREYGFKYKKK